ncbi:hypothetical protein CBM2586_B80130 [Cupriavidus phytorum]|uniref:Uncharacterized protein n=1 Tax=Cupriavidus taiwanensis TaxID=164546 RepID=A0A976ABI9_9BURK|nr:hypothetical protein CBM2586_B80130 [Cupriavidus taiwanensis]
MPRDAPVTMAALMGFVVRVFMGRLREGQGDMPLEPIVVVRAD